MNLDQDQADSARYRHTPALTTTASYTRYFLPSVEQLGMGPAAMPEQWNSLQEAIPSICNPAGLGYASTDVSESIQPLTISSNNQCECLNCLHLGVPVYSGLHACRVPSCDVIFAYGGEFDQGKRRMWHEKKHLEHDGKYICYSTDCKSSFIRWEDLVRHTNKHCLKPQRFPCPEIGCKYSGDNGFVRKDKLKSHYKNAHEGKPRFAQRGPPRLVRPAVAKPSTLTLGGEFLAEDRGEGPDTSGNKRVRRT